MKDDLFDLRPRKALRAPRANERAGYYDYIVRSTYMNLEGRRRGHIPF